MPQPIVELQRLAAVSARPHSVAVDKDTVWVASLATRSIDVMDRRTWTKTGAIETPGMPWGMTHGGGELVMTCGEPPDDNRFIRRHKAGEGFQGRPLGCPEDTGAHVALYNGRLLLAQWYNKRLLLLDSDGSVAREYKTPHGVAGVAVAGDYAYAVATDDEDEGEYWITRIDLRDGSAEDVAVVPFHARGLAFDGEHFWSNDREAGYTVVFALPEDAIKAG